MIPFKLKKGDEIRVVATSRSLAIISKNSIQLAINRLGGLGFKVTFGKNVNERDEFGSSSIKSRVEDIHDAFRDRNVKGILSVVGGYNVNQILNYLDYDLIKKNPKILCGFSDITALQNAIYKKTGLVTYSGPHFSSFGMAKGFEYYLEYFKKAVIEKGAITINPSQNWSDDAWFIDQENRNFIKNSGPFIIKEGDAEGTIIGGNLCTLNLLQGTRFMPSLKDKILFIEDDEDSKPENFDRDLQSLIHQSHFSKIKGIVIGRFQKNSEMTKEKLIKIIEDKMDLDHIPIIADADFGHSQPIITFPIGGKVKILARGKEIKINIIKH